MSKEEHPADMRQCGNCMVIGSSNSNHHQIKSQ